MDEIAAAMQKAKSEVMDEGEGAADVPAVDPAAGNAYDEDLDLYSLYGYK